MIKFNNVDFTYQNAQNGAGVHNITLSIPQGQVVLLCGSSGCGKTTLTRMINGLIPHFYEGEMKGDVTVCGMLTADSDLYEIAPFVGSVFQNPKSQFYTVKTDTEIVFGCENVGMPKKQILSNFENTVKELNISTLLGKSLFSLSGGEKQKIACASVAALFPSIIVMDEPTSNLDMKSISYLKEIIKKWKKSGKTVIIAEHRLYWLMDLADRVIYMDNGYIVQDLLINEFRKYSENDLHQMGLRNSIASENSLYRCNERDTGLTFTDFSFSYKNAPHKALDIEKLSIPKGAIVAVLGNNGAGKTTLMRMLCTIIRPTEGKIRWNGKDIFELGETYRGILGYLPQEFGYYPDMSIYDYLMYIASIKGIRQSVAKQRIDQLLRQVALSKYKKRRMRTLSGGMIRRVGIAQAMLNNPKILVLDEPTAGLDPNERVRFRNLISELSENRLVLLSTHIVSDVEFIANEIILMKGGKFFYTGSTEDLVRSMDESVFQCVVPKNEVNWYLQNYLVGNIKTIPEGAELRIISKTAPVRNAIRQDATLEDAFLLYFGEKAGEDYDDEI